MIAAGRFIVETPTMRSVGLSAHQVRSLLKEVSENEAKVYLIHRVDASGHFELTQISNDRLHETSGAILYFLNIREARAALDVLSRDLLASPPPCAIEVEFSRVPEWEAASVLALSYPQPCDNSVCAWIKGILDSSRITPAKLLLGPNALNEYKAANPMVIEKSNWETRET